MKIGSDSRTGGDPLISRQAVVEGSLIPRRDGASYPIPEKLNLRLVAVQVMTALALLTVAARTTNILETCLLAVVFAFVMQLGFCLAHEAVHGKLHRHKKVNEGFGILLFALFPGSFHFFEIAHLLHHRRNRSDAEIEDYVLPSEVPWLKQVAYYFLICGLFWFLIPLSSLVIAMIPRRSIRIPNPDEDAGVFRRFAQFLNDVRPGRVRRDLVVTGVIWAVAVPVLHLHLAALAICYAAFGFSWASQQYIYHVRTPRHAVLGAFDLHLCRPMEWLYLYFNYHLTHHLAVWVPWIYLPRIAADAPTRGYLVTYFGLWRPPQPVEQAFPSQYQTSGPLPPRSDMNAPAVRDWA
jgi:fatty acid desaturase